MEEKIYSRDQGESGQEKIYSRGQDQGESGQGGEPGRTRGGSEGTDQGEAQQYPEGGAGSTRQSSFRSTLTTRGSSAGLDQSKPKMGVPKAAGERGLTSRGYQGSLP
uniref:(northern house mosquito) hypothetical protein n=1 Tax=Culex pipiens TaxID=7175 RepID=A0A8D8E2I2_CULPI